MNDWQPIETAPKDGTIILVHPATYSGMSASPAYWKLDEYAKRPRPYWQRVDAIQKTTSRDNPPTHWMPMPEVPV